MCYTVSSSRAVRFHPVFRLLAYIILFDASVVGATGQSSDNQASRSKNLQFKNGQWFNGNGFSEATFYVVKGVLSNKPPDHIDSVIDLAGKYVVPPFGEAHNHNIDGFRKVEDRIHQYLADGIFYVKNPTSIPRFTSTLKEKINNPGSIDVVFSNGGLTGSDGHPLELVKRNIGLGIFTKDDAEGGMYYIIDDDADLEKKWASILAAKPDFIKTFLLYSEEYQRRKKDTTYFGWKGLDPALLPLIVKKAHQSGLRVSTHVETATDFHNALMAGADEINHLPGFRAIPSYDISKYFINDEDAELAAKHGVYIVTTLEGTYDPKQSFGRIQDSLNKSNLRILKRHHALIATGSDNYHTTSRPEALYLATLGVFSNMELLKMWCETTPSDFSPGGIFRQFDC
jgi:hypothetical protein